MEPTFDERWYDSLAADIRSKLQPGDEGALWVLFADECPVVRIAIVLESEGTEVGDREYDRLAEVIGEVGPPTVIMAIPRDDGSPLACDWQLWEAMRGRLAALTRTELIDLVVVGAESWWAVVGGRPDCAA